MTRQRRITPDHYAYVYAPTLLYEAQLRMDARGFMLGRLPALEAVELWLENTLEAIQQTIAAKRLARARTTRKRPR